MSRASRGRRRDHSNHGDHDGIASVGSLSVKIAERLRDALDPARAPAPVKRFSKEEIAKLNEQMKAK